MKLWKTNSKNMVVCWKIYQSGKNYIAYVQLSRLLTCLDFELWYDTMLYYRKISDIKSLLVPISLLWNLFFMPSFAQDTYSICRMIITLNKYIFRLFYKTIIIIVLNSLFLKYFQFPFFIELFVLWETYFLLLKISINFIIISKVPYFFSIIHLAFTTCTVRQIPVWILSNSTRCRMKDFYLLCRIRSSVFTRYVRLTITNLLIIS